METSIFTFKSEKCLTSLSKKLLKASSEGDEIEVRNLLTKGASFINDSVGTSALHLASKNGHVNTAACLIRAGLSVNCQNKVGKTPLHFAVSNCHLKMAEILLNNGADINAKDMLQMTPLHWACEKQNLDLIKLLVNNKAKRNCINKFGKTPLELATSKCNLEIARILQLPSNFISNCRSLQQNVESSNGFETEVYTSQQNSIKNLVDGDILVLTEAGKRILQSFSENKEEKILTTNDRMLSLTSINSNHEMNDEEIASLFFTSTNKSSKRRLYEDEEEDEDLKRLKLADDVIDAFEQLPVETSDLPEMFKRRLEERLKEKQDLESWRQQLLTLQQSADVDSKD